MNSIFGLNHNLENNTNILPLYLSLTVLLFTKYTFFQNMYTNFSVNFIDITEHKPNGKTPQKLNNTKQKIVQN